MMATHQRVNPVGRGSKQVDAKVQDAQVLARKVKCVAHAIEYYVGHREKPRCPMCSQEAELHETKARLLAADNELSMLRNRYERLQVQVDLGSAIRAAIGTLDDNDYAWLKIQMYTYRTDKSVTLKPTHGKLSGGKRPARGERLPANGFMALPRQGDPEAHLVTSIGGLAMAEYLDEAILTFGSAQAMGIMLKAWWKALPGGQA